MQLLITAARPTDTESNQTCTWLISIIQPAFDAIASRFVEGRVGLV